jgi:hypothetical protein
MSIGCDQIFQRAMLRQVVPADRAGAFDVQDTLYAVGAELMPTSFKRVWLIEHRQADRAHQIQLPGCQSNPTSRFLRRFTDPLSQTRFHRPAQKTILGFSPKPKKHLRRTIGFIIRTSGSGHASLDCSTMSVLTRRMSLMWESPFCCREGDCGVGAACAFPRLD